MEICKAPSFPRKRKPSVFRSNEPLDPRLRGDDEALLNPMEICKAPSFRRKREPSVFRSNEPLDPRLRGDNEALL